MQKPPNQLLGDLEGLSLSLGSTGDAYKPEDKGTYYKSLDYPGKKLIIVAVDRMKITASQTGKSAKGRPLYFPFRPGWKNSPALEVSGTRVFKKDEEEYEARIFGWNHAFTTGHPYLDGTRLEIGGNGISIELHNILNRYPEKSRQYLFVQVLKGLYDLGILRSGSRSTLYRLAKDRFRVKELEVRFDIPLDHMPVWKLEALDELQHHHEDETLYYTRKGTEGTELRLYPYPVFCGRTEEEKERRKREWIESKPYPLYWRFEAVMKPVKKSGKRPAKPLPKKGTDRQLIDLEKLERVLGKRKDELKARIWPIIEKAEHLETLGYDPEALFIASQAKNGSFTKLL